MTDTPTTFSLFRRLWRSYIYPHRWKMVLAFLFMVVSSLSTAAMARMIKPIIDDIFIARDVNQLWSVCGLVLLTFCLKGLSTFGSSVTLTNVGQRVISRLQHDLFAHLIYCDRSFFHGQTTGQLISPFISDTTLLRSLVMNTLTSLGKDTLTLVFLLTLMCYQDPFLTVIAFVVFPAAVIPIRRLGQRMRRLAGSTQDHIGLLTSFLQQTFQGIDVVKAAPAETYEISRAREVIEHVRHLVTKATRVRFANHPIMETLGGVAVVLVIFYGSWQVIQGHQTAGAFMSFLSALFLAYEPVKSLVSLHATLQEGMASAHRIFALLDKSIEIQDAPQAQPLQLQHHDIQLQGVTFHYTPHQTVLQDLTLRLEGGKTTALVGPSGGGKTTILQLLLRFYDPQQGHVSIDGQDLRSVTLASLRQQVAFVGQHVTLFNDTVAANIAYGASVIDYTRVKRCAQDAAATDFIEQLPQGYETRIGEQGISLSGGQRQRLAIARALYKDAPILLLDEATSALDNTSENQVQEALKRLMRGRTTVLIAHRLSTVQDADKIYVIEDGRVIESGDYTQLMAAGGAFMRLAQTNL